MSENTKKMKGSNPEAMPKIPKQNEGIESQRDTGEPETKGRDRICAQCQRTRFKTKGSILGMISKNLKQKERIESGHKAREPQSKQRDRI